MYGTENPPVRNLIIVACHAVFLADSEFEVEDDRSWVLQPFQLGEGSYYAGHARRGIELAESDSSSLLVFSGGMTRRDAGPVSEASSYIRLSERQNWFGHYTVGARTALEEFARDSFENLLFSICRFYEVTAGYPRQITLVSWRFKRFRFEMHCWAIRLPASRFVFEGVNNPRDLGAAVSGEFANAILPFERDPYGTDCSAQEIPGGGQVVFLGDKRNARNPFGQRHSYGRTNPALRSLIEHTGHELFSGSLPWDGPD